MYGAPPNTLPSGSLAASRVVLPTGGTVDFAASFTDPDSRIVGYDWDFDGDGSVDRSTGEATTSFTYTRAGRLHGRRWRSATTAAGPARRPARSRSRATRKPVVKLPRRGRRGKATARVKCAERCTVTARIRVDGRTVRTVRRTLTTTAERRIALSLPRKACAAPTAAACGRASRSARATRDGRSTTARRTVRIAL